MTVIASCVIGGVSTAGGIGNVMGALLGVLFTGVINGALPVIHISPFWQQAISGFVILVAVIVNARSERRAGKQILPPKGAAAASSKPSCSVARKQIMKATRTWELILVFLKLLIVVAGFSATTEGFLDFYNLSDSTFNYSEKALIALVMALVIAGEIDILVAATVALTSVMMGLAKNAGAGVGVIILVGLASGALCGALNGFLITRFALPSIVVTIGTLSLYRGLALVILGDGAITGYLGRAVGARQRLHRRSARPALVADSI